MNSKWQLIIAAARKLAARLLAFFNPPGATGAVDLFAPPEYWQLTPEDRAQLTNGCGPRRLGGLVPETLLGLSVTEACNIHDYMYRTGKTIEDKESADRVFLNNMLRIIDGETRFGWLRIWRRYRAMTYYSAVRDFGGPAYWAGKNKPEELGRLSAQDLAAITGR